MNINDLTFYGANNKVQSATFETDEFDKIKEEIQEQIKKIDSYLSATYMLDAPQDGKMYVRKDGDWAVLAETTKGESFSVFTAGFVGVYDGSPHHITVESGNNTIQYSIDNINWSNTIPSFIEIGNYITHYRVTTQSGMVLTGSQSVVIEGGTIDYIATSYGGPIDGQFHSPTVTVNTPGCTILYGTQSGVYNLTSPPAYNAAGSYVIFFQITKPNYTTVRDTVNVILRKASAMTNYDPWGSGGNFNIKSGNLITTYADAGYFVRVKVDGTQYNVSSKTYSVAGITFARSVYANEAGQIVIQYDAINTSGAAHNIGISIDSDIMIANNDYAPVYSTPYGFYMTDGTYYFDLYLQNYQGVTNVDGWYFCRYNQRTNYSWTTEKLQGSLTNTDSGMAFNWQNRYIANGQTLTFKAIIDMR